MREPPSDHYLLGSLSAMVLVVLGLAIPWFRKLPTGFHDGQPVATAEGAPLARTGFQRFDFVLLLLLLLTALAVFLGRRYSLRPDILLLATALPVIVMAVEQLLRYRRIDRYAAEPGVYLTLVAGVLLLSTPFLDGLRRYHRSGNDGR